MPFSICDHPLGNIIEFHEKILNPNDSDLSGHEHAVVGLPSNAFISFRELLKGHLCTLT